MTRIIFAALLLGLVLLPLKAVGLFYLWNNVVVDAVTWANPISWLQAFIAIVAYMALALTLSFNESE